MSSQQSEEYELHQVSISDVIEEIDNIWRQLQQPDSPLCKEAENNGIDPAALAQLKSHSRSEALELDHGGGLGAEGIALIVAFAPVAAKITKDVWDKFILPRLQRRFGSKAIERRTRK
jgi:hypothetical protein